MSSAISSQITSIGELLRSNGKLVIPPYQRNYAWDEENYADLWMDIQETFKGCADEYFLGSVVIDNSTNPDLTLIDGQQRVTTTTILICALKWHLQSEDETELANLLSQDFLNRPDYTLNGQQPNLILNLNDRSFFEHHIISATDPKFLKSIADEDTCSPSNLQLARCYIYMCKQIGLLIKEGPSLQTVAHRIITALREKVYLIRIDVEDDLRAFTLFEALNNRGVELSEADLLKNFIFSKAGEHLSIVKNNWENMSLNIGHFSLMRFLRHHWNSNHGAIPSAGLFAAIKKSIETPDDARHLSDQITVSSEYYGAIIDADHDLWQRLDINNINEIKNKLDHLSIIRAEQCYILLLAVLENTPHLFYEYLQMIKNFTFRFSTIGGKNTAELLRTYIKTAHAIRENTRNQQADISAAEAFNLFFKDIYPQDNQFQSTFSKKTIKSTVLARYILSEINNNLSDEEAPRYSATSTETDLEHILPKKFLDHWKTPNKDFPGGATKFINRLGNMTLISPELNRRLGNTNFEAKKEVYAKDCLEITTRILEEEKWTASAINRRQNWLAGEAVKIWRFPLD